MMVGMGRALRTALRVGLTVGVIGVLAAAPARAQEERSVVLDRVVDGDTLRLRDGTRVRLIGIDTPEVAHPDFGDECYGEEASRYVERLLRPGDELRLVFDVDRFDQYGRTLAYVYRGVDDLFVNAQLLKKGYAYIEFVEPNTAHERQFRRLAAQAREAGRGLWSACPNDGTKPVSVAGTCLPSYVGACVPAPPPDLECADVGAPVRVVGDDPHHLDADGDGRACESEG